MGRQQFTLGSTVEQWFRPWPVQLALMLLAALVTRASVLGDPAYDSDETLFFLIGQKMLDGYVPYVDIWDRKGPSLFLLFAGLAAISESVLAYQIPALLCAALTAFLLVRIAHRQTGLLGALLAGIFYLALLPRITGGGGQAGVWINLLVVLAAWLVLARPVAPVPARHAAGAMLLCGLAISFKQTALFDGIFLGLFLLWRHRQAGASASAITRTALLYAALGALPMALWTGYYLAIGHFAEFWHAMVLSNLDKAYVPSEDIAPRILAMALVLAPVLFFAVAGMLRPLSWEGKKPDRAFLGGWLCAVLLALVAVPNFFDHYLLPVIVVLALCAAPALQREPVGVTGGLLGIVLILSFGPQFDWDRRAASRAAIERLTAELAAARPEPRLFVFQGPVALYSTTGQVPPTPLLFPFHLEILSERNASHLDTATEVRRILAWQPTTVLMRPQRRKSENPETFALVDAYVRANCPARETINLPNRFGDQQFDVWSDCRVAPATGMRP